MHNLIERGTNIGRESMALGAVFLGLGKGAVSKSLDVVLRIPPNDDFVRALKSSALDHDIEQATSTYELGRKRKDPELGFLGGGWLLKLLCRADADPKVPDQKVEEIAQYIINERLNPELEPFVNDEEAAQAAELLDKHNPVTEVFFRYKK